MAVVVNPTCLALALCLCTLPALAAPEPAEQAYQAARKGYYALKGDAKRRKFRDSWLTVAHRFEGVAKKYPKSPRAPDSLFTAAQLLSDLSRISLLAEDASASMEDYRTLLEGYPRSTLADDAALALARAYLEREQPEAARKVLQRAAQLPNGGPDCAAPGPGWHRSRPSRRTPAGRPGRASPSPGATSGPPSRARPRRATAPADTRASRGR